MKLNPYWVSGFVDGEGTFYIGINRQSSMTVGYQVLPEFRVVQHKRDIRLLYGLKAFFGCGVVRVNHEERYELRVRDIKHLKDIIIPFFRKYQLNTQKKFDFYKFQKVIGLMAEGCHLKEAGVLEITKIAEQMNRREKNSAISIKEEILSRLN